MNNSQQTAPEKITFIKLKPEELTDPKSRLFTDGHLFPLAIHSTPASDYDAPVYRMITSSDNKEVAA